MNRNNLTLFRQLANLPQLRPSAARALTAIALISTFGCAPTQGPRAGLAAREQVGPRSFLVSEPAKSFKPLTVNVVALLPLTANFGVGLSPEDLERLSLKMVREFELRSSLDIRNTSATQEFLNAVEAQANAQQPLRSNAAAVGRKLEAQGVIYAQITRYVESDGSKLGASNSGAAGFRLWLVDPRTEAVLWTATYDEQNQPLSDNLLKLPGALRHGVSFHSAEEILSRGFAAAAEALERLRKAPTAP